MPPKGSVYPTCTSREGNSYVPVPGFNCLNYLIASRNQNTERECGMEGESLRD